MILNSKGESVISYEDYALALVDEYFYSLQDEIIKEEYRHKVIVDIHDLKPIKGNIYLYLCDFNEIFRVAF